MFMSVMFFCVVVLLIFQNRLNGKLLKLNKELTDTSETLVSSCKDLVERNSTLQLKYLKAVERVEELESQDPVSQREMDYVLASLTGQHPAEIPQTEGERVVEQIMADLNALPESRRPVCSDHHLWTMGNRVCIKCGAEGDFDG